MERFERLGRLVSMHVALEQAQQLKPTDFEGFYRNRWDDIYRTLAVTFRDPDLAAEAVDEAMTRAYERWRKVKRASNPSGWVYRVAYNWAIDQLRRRKRRQGEVIATSPSIEPQLPEPGLSRALDELPLDQRAVIVLRVVHDWSMKDVGYALDIPVGTVKSRLSRGLEKLRKELES